MSAAEPAEHGYTVRRLVQFGRTLREAGLSVGAQQISELANALAAIDLARQDDFYFTQRSFLVHNADEREVFDRLFELFWLGRSGLSMEMGVSQKRSSAMLPERTRKTVTQPGRSRALPGEDDAPAGDEQEPNITSTYSALELLRHKDFRDYSDEEAAAARAVMQRLLWRLEERPTRRHVRTSKQTASLDLPRVIRTGVRRNGELVELAWKQRKRKPRPLVVICDVSGSMERYARLFLFLMHGMMRGASNIEAFVFGTRLTRITPALRHADVDTALDRASDLVLDWSGGTRIGESLRVFNLRWSRRVLGHGAVALIISDGWDRGDQVLLDAEIRRLRRGVHRLIWLNPLAGSPSYQPLVRGIQTILPHVDEMLPMHNLDSMATLAGKLGAVRL
ncbi:MAG: VWA domain-containing protein [Anaerolineae bacterium]|nr:VWA domain-containing protein [Anaerolineae bacterium]